MGVHACVSWRTGREASLQERATQPGSLGLGAGSGIPTLLLSHADQREEGTVLERGRQRETLRATRSHRLEVRPRSSPLTVVCRLLGPLRIQACHGTHSPAVNTSMALPLTRCQQRQHQHGGALAVHPLGSHPSSATDSLSEP